MLKEENESQRKNLLIKFLFSNLKEKISSGKDEISLSEIIKNNKIFFDLIKQEEKSK